MNQLILSLISAIFIGGAAGYLGSLMVTKRMGIVGGPLSHLALPGVAIALTWHFNPFWGALLTIVLGGVLVWFLEIKTKAPMEALTGLVFAFGVGLGFLILPFSNEETLKEALIGDITKISLIDAILAMVLSTAIFIVIRKVYPKLILAEISSDLAKVEGINIKKCNFIYLSAITLVVALGVKLVGGLLPVGLIVIPALSSRNISRNLGEYSLGSLAFGILSCLSGILLFEFTGLSAGLLIIMAATAFYLTSLIFEKST